MKRTKIDSSVSNTRRVIYDPATGKFLDGYDGEAWEWRDDLEHAWRFEPGYVLNRKVVLVKQDHPNADSMTLSEARAELAARKAVETVAQGRLANSMALLMLKKIRYGKEPWTSENVLVDVNNPSDPCLFYTEDGKVFHRDSGRHNWQDSAQKTAQRLNANTRLGPPNKDTLSAINEDLNLTKVEAPFDEGGGTFDEKLLRSHLRWVYKRAILVISSHGYWGRGATIQIAANQCYESGAKRTDFVTIKLVIGDEAADVSKDGYVIGAPGAAIVDIGKALKLSGLLPAKKEGV